MSVGPFIIIDDVFDDTTVIDRLYDLLVNENVSIPVEPPNFIRMDDLEYSPERSEVDNLLRKCIQKVWMDKLYALLKDKDERGELIGFEEGFKSIASFCPEKTIISTGLSKWCGAGGWMNE